MSRKPPPITVREIEVAVAEYLDFRRNLIVPNVSWGVGLGYWGVGLGYEADLLVVRASGWIEEIEIKTTRSALRADCLKEKWNSLDFRRSSAPDLFPHASKKVRRFWLAFPRELADDPSILPHAGILAIGRDRYGDLIAEKVREAAVNKAAVKATSEDIAQLHRLAAMRIWSLKKHLIRLQERRREL